MRFLGLAEISLTEQVGGVNAPRPIPPVRRVAEAVALYPNRDGLFRNYPELEPDDVKQALAFAAANLEDGAMDSNAA